MRDRIQVSKVAAPGGGPHKLAVTSQNGGRDLGLPGIVGLGVPHAGGAILRSGREATVRGPGNVEHITLMTSEHLLLHHILPSNTKSEKSSSAKSFQHKKEITP
jgi:hypothetical protein